jgi:hypothetical protein
LWDDYAREKKSRGEKILRKALDSRIKPGKMLWALGSGLWALGSGNYKHFLQEIQG